MQKYNILLYTILLFFVITSLAFAQPNDTKPVVLLSGLETVESDSTLSNLAFVIRDNIAFTLKLMGLYQVTELENVIPYDDTASVKQTASENNADNVIFGRINRDTGGRIVIQMAVYDKQQDSITLTEEVAIEDIFGIFDAGDELVVKLIEGFSGEHVAYGTLKLINTGEPGAYTISIDGQPAGGDSPAQISNVFYGPHKVKLAQQRPLGEYLLYEGDVIVPENGTVPVEFSIPT